MRVNIDLMESAVIDGPTTGFGANRRREKLGRTKRKSVTLKAEEAKRLEQLARERGEDEGRLLRLWALPHLKPKPTE